jgi:hypothetical protein
MAKKCVLEYFIIANFKCVKNGKVLETETECSTAAAAAAIVPAEAKIETLD